MPSASTFEVHILRLPGVIVLELVGLERRSWLVPAFSQGTNRFQSSCQGARVRAAGPALKLPVLVVMSSMYRLVKSPRHHCPWAYTRYFFSST